MFCFAVFSACFCQIKHIRQNSIWITAKSSAVFFYSRAEISAFVEIIPACLLNEHIAFNSRKMKLLTEFCRYQTLPSDDWPYMQLFKTDYAVFIGMRSAVIHFLLLCVYHWYYCKLILQPSLKPFLPLWKDFLQFSQPFGRFFYVIQQCTNTFLQFLLCLLI